jgi:hypothetical protein
MDYGDDAVGAEVCCAGRYCVVPRVVACVLGVDMTCGHCGKKFWSLGALYRHMKAHHDG